MKFREQLLEVLRQPGYRPSTILDLSRAVGLNKKQRPQFAHEVRTLLGKGELSLVNGDRIVLPNYRAGGGGSSKPAREVFQPRSQQSRHDSAPASSSDRETLTGRISFRAGGSAFVMPVRDTTVPSADVESIQIFPEDTGVALHGDIVEILVNPGIRQRRDGRGTERTGRVLDVVERARDTVVGNLQKIRSSYYVKPDDPRMFHEVSVGDPALTKLKPTPAVGDKVVVQLSPWTKRSQLLQGEIIERLGKTFEPRAELAGIYHKFKLDPTFPAAVEREVASLPDTVQPSELTGRLDYREIPTFTIDPDDAKDFDDALSLEYLDNGDIRVGIHIADVSAYVKPGTELDKEAQRRGNSTYLVGTVIPMLPEKLSNGLCSLVEAQDRLTKAVFLVFDPKGRPKSHTYANTVIRSRKRLTYKQAYALLFEDSFDKIRALPLPAKHQTGSTGRALSSLDDTELTDLQKWVRQLWKIAAKLRHDRMANGSLDLDMPETKVFVDAEGYADRLEKIEHDESHQLIEEFMLSANEAVARLTKNNKLPSIYRVHDDPDAEKLNELREFLVTYEIRTGDLTVREELVKLLQLLAHHPQGYTLRTQLLRSLKKAAYRGSPDGHYGLAKNDYTHFTSPIRRYSDLIVHRVFDHYLIKHEGKKAPANYNYGYSAAKMDSLGEHLSLTEINSTEAERESVKIKLLEFFERELAKEKKTKFAAVITDVRPNGLFVELIESMTFGFIPITVLTDDVYTINGSGDALVGRRTKTTYQLAARLEVAVEKVDRFKRLIDFRPAGPGGSAATSAMPMDKPVKPHPSVPLPKKKPSGSSKPKSKKR
ncbi:MAG TPA: RNB domain-containing ribonuclease [Rariglobus sp.]|nr:RNB domain-containing ribonuclease [Rariglobus sp.]